MQPKVHIHAAKSAVGNVRVEHANFHGVLFYQTPPSSHNRRLDKDITSGVNNSLVTISNVGFVQILCVINRTQNQFVIPSRKTLTSMKGISIS